MLKQRINYILQISVQEYAESETLQHVLLFAQKNENQKLTEGTFSPVTAHSYSAKIRNRTS